MNSSQGGRTPSPPERSTSTRTFEDIFSTAAIQENRRLKAFNELNKPFDPGGRGEKAPPWKAAVPLPFFSWSEAGRLLFCFVYALFFFLFSRTYIFPFTDESYQQDVFSSRGQVMYATGGRAFSRLLPYLKMARTSNAWFGRSTNTLGGRAANLAVV